MKTVGTKLHNVEYEEFYKLKIRIARTKENRITSPV